MTIALGFLAADSMIIAADSELSYSEFTKTSARKVYLNGEAGVLAVTGAGDVGYIDAIRQEIKQAFLAHPKASVDELEKVFRSVLKSFFRDHVLPFAGFPDAPSLYLIVAAERGQSSRMWVTHRNTLTRVPRYKAIGIGASYANHLLGELFNVMEPDIAKAIAAYVIFRVKQFVQGCGQSTDAICIHKTGTISSLDEYQVEDLEHAFKQYIGAEAHQLHRALGSEYPFSSEENIGFLMKAVRKRAKGIFHPSKATSSESP